MFKNDRFDQFVVWFVSDIYLYSNTKKVVPASIVSIEKVL